MLLCAGGHRAVSESVDGSTADRTPTTKEVSWTGMHWVRWARSVPHPVSWTSRRPKSGRLSGEFLAGLGRGPIAVPLQ
jgi:hypothetical protein